ncbi:hypothetical protein AAEJ42_23110, partial [Shewanella algae]|uniref:hypothetical protein n=1 Tax=Shewanella algae TaxID=38313 RepID=UPI00313DC162
MNRNILIKGGNILPEPTSTQGKADGYQSSEVNTKDIRIEDGVIVEVADQLSAHSGETVVD